MGGTSAALIGSGSKGKPVSMPWKAEESANARFEETKCNVKEGPATGKRQDWKCPGGSG